MYYWHRNPQCSPPPSTPFVSSLVGNRTGMCTRICAMHAHICMYVYASGYRVAFYKPLSRIKTARNKFFRWWKTESSFGNERNVVSRFYLSVSFFCFLKLYATTWLSTRNSCWRTLAASFQRKYTGLIHCWDIQVLSNVSRYESSIVKPRVWRKLQFFI